MLLSLRQWPLPQYCWEERLYLVGCWVLHAPLGLLLQHLSLLRAGQLCAHPLDCNLQRPANSVRPGITHDYTIARIHSTILPISGWLQ